MADEIPSIIHHVSIGTDDLPRAVAFYDRASRWVQGSELGVPKPDAAN